MHWCPDCGAKCFCNGDVDPIDSQPGFCADVDCGHYRTADCVARQLGDPQPLDFNDEEGVTS